jgi:hypothetical protein
MKGKSSRALEDAVSTALQLSTLDRVRLIECIVPTIEAELLALSTAAPRIPATSDIDAPPGVAAGSAKPGDPTRPLPGPGSFFEPTPSIDELAAQQGVRPVERFEDLLGDFWPEDESIDDFIATVRRWRREGG